MSLPYTLSFDQGTTRSRAILFNQAGEIVSLTQKEFTQIYSKPDWVEYDPKKIWSTQIVVATETIFKDVTTPANIAVIDITNQRDRIVVRDRETGEPVYNAVVWQNRRTVPLLPV